MCTWSGGVSRACVQCACDGVQILCVCVCVWLTRKHDFGCLLYGCTVCELLLLNFVSELLSINLSYLMDYPHFLYRLPGGSHWG